MLKAHSQAKDKMDNDDTLLQIWDPVLCRVRFIVGYLKILGNQENMSKSERYVSLSHLICKNNYFNLHKNKYVFQPFYAKLYYTVYFVTWKLYRITCSSSP